MTVIMPCRGLEWTHRRFGRIAVVDVLRPLVADDQGAMTDEEAIRALTLGDIVIVHDPQREDRV